MILSINLWPYFCSFRTFHNPQLKIVQKINHKIQIFSLISDGFSSLSATAGDGFGVECYIYDITDDFIWNSHFHFHPIHIQNLTFNNFILLTSRRINLTRKTFKSSSSPPFDLFLFHLKFHLLMITQTSALIYNKK